MDFKTGTIDTNIPLVTIGVLSYNYSQYIDAALQSLLTQTYPNIELIIVDDCSTEKEVPVKIEQWIEANNLHCQFIRNEHNLGITKVSNKIVQMAKGKYICLFATDDIMLPEKIARQVAILEAAGEAYGMCYCNARKTDEEDHDLGFYSPPDIFKAYEGDVLEPYVYNLLTFATPTTLIRRSVYERAGMYDERVLFEDYNFWLRVFALFKVTYCDYPGIIYREKKESGVFSTWKANNRELYYRDRILSNLQGLQYTDNKKVRARLKSKISQYLKTLVANGSGYAPQLVKYLLTHGYFAIPANVLLKSFFVKEKNVQA